MNINYRKKPVVIQAMQWDGTRESAELIKATLDHDDDRLQLIYDANRYDLHCLTLEGLMKASKGDWIIKGVKDELYPCKPDIFAATYEKADN